MEPKAVQDTINRLLQLANTPVDDYETPISALSCLYLLKYITENNLKESPVITANEKGLLLAVFNNFEMRFLEDGTVIGGFYHE